MNFLICHLTHTHIQTQGILGFLCSTESSILMKPNMKPNTLLLSQKLPGSDSYVSLIHRIRFSRNIWLTLCVDSHYPEGCVCDVCEKTNLAVST